MNFDDVAVDKKYEWNRSERQVARTDVPLARVVQTEEDKRQQIEAMEHMENLKKRLLVVSVPVLHIFYLKSGLCHVRGSLSKPGPTWQNPLTLALTHGFDCTCFVGSGFDGKPMGCKGLVLEKKTIIIMKNKTAKISITFTFVLAVLHMSDLRYVFVFNVIARLHAWLQCNV